jgi:hypothetical protein
MRVRYAPGMRGRALLSALLATSCSVGVSLENRPCPCDEARGWFCDPSTNTCISSTEGACGVPGAARSAIGLDVRVAWRTDTAIEIAWAVAEADRERVDHYELVVGRSRDAVESRGEGARVFGREDPEHPELQRRDLPGTADGDPVDSVILRELEPDTTYFVQLVLYDDTGAVRCEPALEVLTYVRATTEITLYDEDRWGYSIPDCIYHTEDAALASSDSFFALFRAHCEGLEAICETPTSRGPICFEHVRLHNLGGPEGIGIDLAPGPFRDAAHFQIDVALDESEHGYWAELYIVTRSPPPDEDPNALEGPLYEWGASAQTLVADGEYRTYTVPLGAMHLHCSVEQRMEEEARIAANPDTARQCGALPLSADDLRRGVSAVRVGTFVSDEGAMRVDRAVIRY